MDSLKFLNKSATVKGYTAMSEPTSRDAYRWLSEPRWYLWEGGFLLIARADGVVPSHAHHAIQIVIALEGEVAIRGTAGDWLMGQGVIVRPDAAHSFNCNGALGAMLFVDPESVEGRWLRSSLQSDITIVSGPRLTSSADELRKFIEQPFEGMEIGELIRHCVQALSPGVPPARRPDARVTAVLDTIRELDDLHISLERAAEKAFLSPSRFAHLFKEQVGLPFSRYVLWRKLTRAMVAIASEGTIAAAAHAADFADAAHLTRTFYQMVGMAPSVLMRGEFAEIPSPFREDFSRGERSLTVAPLKRV
ncbi:MAG: helix-turn-helix domain-containing protein [Bryobacterales bacterium]|nr:helix-turn-helix domain-containing protein [Bryobacterales bacterium]